MLAELAPALPTNNDNILAHISTRYLIPYFAGIIAYITSFELLSLLKY